jgi:hypothetical protein
MVLHSFQRVKVLRSGEAAERKTYKFRNAAHGRWDGTVVNRFQKWTAFWKLKARVLGRLSCTLRPQRPTRLSYTQLDLKCSAFKKLNATRQTVALSL